MNIKVGHWACKCAITFLKKRYVSEKKKEKKKRDFQKRKDKYAEKRWGLQNCSFKASRGRAIHQQTHTFPFGDPGIPRPKVSLIFCPNFPFFPYS